MEANDEVEERPVEKLSRFFDSITTYFDSMPDLAFLPYQEGAAPLRYCLLAYDFKTKHCLRYSTPDIDWYNMHMIDMRKGRLFGVRNGSGEAWKLTVKQIRMAEIELEKERFDYNGTARSHPALVNVNDKYAYLIGG